MVEGKTKAQFAEESPGEFIDAVLEAMVVLMTSHLTSSQLKERITMDPNDPTKIKDVDFSRLGIEALPELFMSLRISGKLDLSYNQLRYLPELIGILKVGGDLDLSHNFFRSLPETFGTIQVGGLLDLSNNALYSIPETMGSMTVGGDLNLYDNDLHEVPVSMGSMKVGGSLNLQKNGLKHYPEGTKEGIQVGGDVYSDFNIMRGALDPAPTKAQWPNVEGEVYVEQYNYPTNGNYNARAQIKGKCHMGPGVQIGH